MKRKSIDWGADGGDSSWVAFRTELYNEILNVITEQRMQSGFVIPNNEINNKS